MAYPLDIDRRPLPLGEQANREYHSGDPDPWSEPCPDCGDLIDEDDRWEAWEDKVYGEWYHADCQRSHNLSRCTCADCDADRAADPGRWGKANA